MVHIYVIMHGSFMLYLIQFLDFRHSFNLHYNYGDANIERIEIDGDSYFISAIFI